MTLSRCDCCDGRKQLVGLGGMTKDCGNCKGVGFVKSQTVLDTVVTVKRKRRTPAEMLADADKVE